MSILFSFSILGPRKHRKEKKKFSPEEVEDQNLAGSEKRSRTNFDPSQLETLKHEFDLNPYLSEERRKHLAMSLELAEMQVKIWFQNRRAKLKKLKCKKT